MKVETNFTENDTFFLANFLVFICHKLFLKMVFNHQFYGRCDQLTHIQNDKTTLIWYLKPFSYTRMQIVDPPSNFNEISSLS